jgi:ABC-type branched-subunit amino acid transport system substrate-binding protein
MAARPGRPSWVRRHPLWTAVIAVAVAAAAAGGTVGRQQWQDSRRHCAAGVQRYGGECVGVTDGAFSFMRPELDDVSGKIKAENDRVLREARTRHLPYVTIAFARPMDVRTGSRGHREGVRHGLQGAYAAQWRANHSQVRGDTPLIRLAIADFGENSGHWQPTVDELAKAARGRDHLVAVAGLSRSTGPTTAAMRALSRKGIPMVADVLTADTVDGVHDLARVAPTNSDEARAAATYLVRHGSPGTVQLVFDRSTGDSYVTSLRRAFTRAYPGPGRRLITQGGSYNSALPALGNRFASLIEGLCLTHTHTVYFAGRAPALQQLVTQFGHRPCTHEPFTVITGDDATLLRGDAEFDQALHSGVSVVYTALSHPGMWKGTRGASVDPGAVDFFTRGGEGTDFFTLFPHSSPGELADGQVVMAHDAVLTAIYAARQPETEQRETPDVPTPGTIAQNLPSLRGKVNRVPGASGYISLDNDGHAEGKAIPVLERLPGNGVAFREVVSGTRR